MNINIIILKVHLKELLVRFYSTLIAASGQDISTVIIQVSVI